MARRKTILNLLDGLEADVQAAFLKAIQNIKRDTDLRAFIAAWKRGDVEAALRAIPLRAEYLAPLDRVFYDAYQDGGDWIASEIAEMAKGQGARVAFRFNPRNLRAERFIAESAAERVVQIVDATRERAREVLLMGMQAGTSPQQAALDLVGRSRTPTSPRRGGIIGLNSQRVDQITSVREMLSDAERVREYFIVDHKTGAWKNRYKSVDKRMNARVRKAIKDGRAVDADTIREITTRQSNRLLRERGQTIARTELLSSLSHAQSEGLQQMVDQGVVSADQVTLKWDSAEDGATRPSHRAADNQERKQGQPFNIGGYQMMHPGDSSLGAPASEIVRCRCVVRPDIDFIARLGPDD